MEIEKNEKQIKLNEKKRKEINFESTQIKTNK